jgi:hypothetical protein
MTGTSDIIVQKRENFRITTWNNFVSVEQAIIFARKQTGKVQVFKDEEIVWENEEALVEKYPKKVTCKFYGCKSGIHKTIVTVYYQNLATKLWDTYLAESEKLNELGLSNQIETSIRVSAEVGKHLEVGIFVKEGEVELEDFIAEMTPYRMAYVCQKAFQESIGAGRLPGSVWEFELKEDSTLK